MESKEASGKILLKFGKKKHILDCFKKEYLRFSKLGGFRKEDKEGIGREDPREGNLDNIQVKELTLNPNSENKIELHNLDSFIAQKTSYSTAISKLICCMFTMNIYTDPTKNKFDDRMLGFGDFVLVIFNIPVFKKTLENNKNLEGDEVTYYDQKKYNGSFKKYYFYKDIKLSYQNDYRLVLHNSNLNRKNLHIPDLKKMAFVCEPSMLK